MNKCTTGNGMNFSCFRGRSRINLVYQVAVQVLQTPSRRFVANEATLSRVAGTRTSVRGNAKVRPLRYARSIYLQRVVAWFIRSEILNGEIRDGHLRSKRYNSVATIKWNDSRIRKLLTMNIVRMVRIVVCMVVIELCGSMSVYEIFCRRVRMRAPSMEVVCTHRVYLGSVRIVCFVLKTMDNNEGES